MLLLLLVKEALVMAHHHLALELLRGIQRYADDNDDGGTSHRQAVQSGDVGIEDREERDDRQEQRADQGDS